jgi:hypothetical protein
MIFAPFLASSTMKPRPRVRSPRPLVLCALVVAAAVAPDAGAADKPRAAAKKSADAILTPEQLRECLAQQSRRDQATESALKVKAALAADKAALERSGAALSEEATTLDRTSEDAVNAYNAKVDERDQQIAAYEQKLAAYNKDAESVQALTDAYAKTCGNRRYDDRDLADIQRKK